MFSIYSERLREIMNSRGTTQKWLAESAQTTEATISRYLTMNSCPSSLELLKNIAVALNVSADFLLGITNLAYPKESLPEDLKIVLDHWSQISDSDKKVMWALLDKYLSPSDRAKLE